MERSFYQPLRFLRTWIIVSVMTRFRSVLITGASSGIGRALALALAAPG